MRSLLPWEDRRQDDDNTQADRCLRARVRIRRRFARPFCEPTSHHGAAAESSRDFRFHLLAARRPLGMQGLLDHYVDARAFG